MKRDLKWAQQSVIAGWHRLPVFFRRIRLVAVLLGLPPTIASHPAGAGSAPSTASETTGAVPAFLGKLASETLPQNTRVFSEWLSAAAAADAQAGVASSDSVPPSGTPVDPQQLPSGSPPMSPSIAGILQAESRLAAVPHPDRKPMLPLPENPPAASRGFPGGGPGDLGWDQLGDLWGFVLTRNLGPVDSACARVIVCVSVSLVCACLSVCVC